MHPSFPLTFTENGPSSALFSFLTPKELARFSRVSKHTKALVDKKIEHDLGKLHFDPLLKMLWENSAAIKGASSWREKIKTLHEYLVAAQNYKSLTTHKTIIFNLELSSNIQTRPIDFFPQNPLSTEVLFNNPVKYFITMVAKVSLADIYFISQVRNEEVLLGFQDLTIFKESTILNIFSCWLCQKKENLIQEMYPKVNLSPEGVSRFTFILTHSIKKTIREGDLSRLQTLLNLRLPFNPDEALIESVLRNEEEITTLLLNTDLRFNENYCPTNGTSDNFAQPSGLQAALMFSAVNYHEQTLDAILKARPAQQIDQRILGHIKMRLSYFPSADDYKDTIEKLDREIRSRFF